MALIADVSGHGAVAALAAAQTQAYVRALAEYLPTPGAVLTAVNHHISDRLTGGNFVTACLVMISAGENVLS